MGRIFRLFVIQSILIKYRLDDVIFTSHLLQPVRFLRYLLPWNWLANEHIPMAVRCRHALEELGPIYVKLGQMLSTRHDLLPGAIAEEFAKLQDRVLPFSGKQARELAEQAYECALEELFLEFDETPIASASVAQVHAAVLKNGRQCIVKIIRPGIKKDIRRDLDLIYFLVKQSDRYYPKGRALRFTGIIQELEKTLLNELDLKREAANAAQLRRNFKDEQQYYVPEVNWELTRKNVMVMERISGIPISDIQGLKRANIDLKWLAEYGIQIFFMQVFRDNFFHADMHPGNIFVLPPQAGKVARVAVVDFGIMSSLTPFDQHYLAKNFLAFLDRDYQRVAALHVESGWVPVGTRLDELEFAVRTVCEPLLERPIQEISFGELLERLLHIAQHFNVEIMPQLILLQKTIINIEGIGRQLYPELDLWTSARLQIERWMNERIGMKGLLKRLGKNMPNWIDQLPDLPNKLLFLVDQGYKNHQENSHIAGDIKRLRKEMEGHHRRTRTIIAGATLLLCAVLAYGNLPQLTTMVAGVPLLAWIIGGGGLLLLIFTCLRQ